MWRSRLYGPWRIDQAAIFAISGSDPSKASHRSIAMALHHKVLAGEQWIEARRQLLIKEKEFTKARDALSRARRDLPWERVEKSYLFDGPHGKETLSDLFAGK